MIDIFISYARPDRRLAERLSNQLTSRGFSVWWDRELLSGEEFRSTLLARLREAKAVLVIWTDRSIGSRWVCEEAEEAAEQRKLVATCEDGFDLHELPLGFRSFQTVPLSDHAGIVAAVRAAAGRAATPAAPSRPAPPKPAFRGRRAALAAGAAAIAVAATAAVLLYPSTSTDADTSDIVLRDREWGPRQRQLIALGRRLESEFQAATDLRDPPIPRAAFARPLATIEEIRALDPSNGHIQYFTGTIARWMARPGVAGNASHQAFFRYLELAGTVGSPIADTGPGSRWCYDRPWGICTERTAWINHQLAWDYHRIAEAEPDPGRRRHYHRRAHAFAREAVRLFPGGFDQGLPTREIEARSAAGAQSPPPQDEGGRP